MRYEKYYPKLFKMWKGEIYQNLGNIKRKMRILKKYLKRFKGKKVLEIGCNAGIQVCDIEPQVLKYIGIEPHKNFYEQALITKKYADLKKAEFHNMYTRELVKKEFDFDMLFMSFSIYHLENDEIDILRERVLPKCNYVFILNRDEGRKNPDNNYQFEKPENMKRFLKDAGFSVKTKLMISGGWADDIWLIIGERNDKLQNQGEPKEDKQETPDSSSGRGAFSNQGRVADNDKSGTVEQQGVAGGENSDIQAVEPEQGDQDILRDRGQEEHEQPQGEKHIQDDAEAIGAEGLPEADTVE